MSRAHREYFNKLAEEWHTEMPDDPSFRDYLIRFGVSSGDRVLDIGAGTGRMTKYLAEIVGKEGLVVAEDIAEQMLFEGKKLLDRTPQEWVCDDVLALAFKDGSFDRVLCFSAFPHFTSPLSALREMKRILRKEGKLLILHTDSSTRLNEFHASQEGVVCTDVLPSINEIRPLLNQAGFVEEEFVDKENLYWIQARRL